MTTLHLPGDEPQPHTAEGPERVPLARLAAEPGSALVRMLARMSRRPAEVVAEFNSTI